MKVHFHFITLFPETISPWLTTSILGRAKEAGVFDFSTYQLRDYSENKHKTVDDAAYGGGKGMVLCIEPLVAAVESIKKSIEGESQVIYFSPVAPKLTHTSLKSWVEKAVPHYIFVCGHYEGADQRFIDNWVDSQVSLGDFIVTGGELPALAFTDAFVRLLSGTLSEEATLQESFALVDPDTGKELLEYPHYTRPSTYRGLSVPEVLLSGNHERVDKWRMEQSRLRSQERPT